MRLTPIRVPRSIYLFLADGIIGMRLAPFRVQRSIYLFLADDMRLAPLGQSVDQSDSPPTVAHISGSGSQPYSTKELIDILVFAFRQIVFS